MKVELQCGDTIAIPDGCKATIKDGVIIFEEEEKFKDGDILVTFVDEERYNAFIYKDTDKNGFHSYYVGVDACKQLSISTSPSNRWCNSNLFYATEDEKQLLFKKMKEQGLKWNAKEKRVEKLRWRAEKGEKYFTLKGATLVIDFYTENFDRTDEKCHEYGNYFRTEEQAEEAAKRIKEVLYNYHEEIKE
ncbi:hypothetical protein [Prevotella pallens]|uniref:hypothetical protein n=1 Tax=Prevotella pallens TaxID=60133 RepID=UPI0028DD1FD8|nr:hypothetical protein [Prevotella pallens]